MATTTTNFGWDIPQSTDLVKDGATAIATLGQDIDTALVDLKGGTTGQFLAKASGTDLDYTWSTPSAGGMTVIQSGSLSGTTTSLTSIPSTYKDLRLVLRNVYMTPTSTVYQFQFNSDTGNKYTYIWQNNTAATNVTDSASFNHDHAAVALVAASGCIAFDGCDRLSIDADDNSHMRNPIDSVVWEVHKCEIADCGYLMPP